jgi:[glutamine synthetase] adenylyltransferase / [glutamine synthetase]-adenylyl-L-tyrosine phosphorylase
VPGGCVALRGMGRLGSREMTANSDLDLLLLYDHDPAAEESDGPKPLPVSVYYIRLTQRLIAALSAPMGEGVLYDVDFRLRPSGNKGPLATHIGAFRKYQENEAWTWERMALTRSRSVAGDPGFCACVDRMVSSVLAEPRDADVVRRDIAAMRARLERDKPARGPLDVKLLVGGLLDLEFIAQGAILSGEVGPAMIGAPTAAVLAAVDALPALRNGNPAVSLSSSMRTYTRVIQLTRLGSSGIQGIASLPQGLAERVARALDLDGPEGIETAVGDMAVLVRGTFERLLPLVPDDAA